MFPCILFNWQFLIFLDQFTSEQLVGIPTSLHLYNRIVQKRLKFPGEEFASFRGMCLQSERVLLLADWENSCVKQHDLLTGQTTQIWKEVEKGWRVSNVCGIKDAAGDALAVIEIHADGRRLCILRPIQQPANTWSVQQILDLPEKIWVCLYLHTIRSMRGQKLSIPQLKRIFTLEYLLVFPG